MSVVLQISDPHFGTERAAVVEALVALARLQQPDLLVLSGDITQRARPRQFGLARALVDRLAAPMLAIPGNHDIALFDLAAMDSVVRPQSTASVLAMNASVESRKLAPNSAPAINPGRAPRNAAAPQAQAAAASMAPSSEGIR